MKKSYFYKGRSVFLLTTVVFALLFSCRKRTSDCPNSPQYQLLSTSAKEWFPYTADKKLIFENSTSQKDTLELTNYFFGDDAVYSGDECSLTKGQFLRGNFIDKKSGDTIKAQIGYGDQVQIEKKKGTGYILFFDTKSILILASPYRRLEPNVTLNNKMYNLVLLFECSPTDNCVTTGITKFYFAKTKGLVAYQRNGVLWTLK